MSACLVVVFPAAACAAEPSAATTSPGLHVISSAGDDWVARITIKDYLQEYVFPEELISYPVVFPPAGVRPEHLHLLAESSGASICYQLAGVKQDQGFLRSATIRFRTALGKGETKSFLLRVDPAYRADFARGVRLRNVDPQSHTAVLDAQTQQVKVPYGEFSPHAPVSAVPAPVLRVSRTYGSWVGHGRFSGQVLVEQVRTSIVEEGPLKLVYRIDYTLSGGKSYAVVLTLQAGDTFVTVDEYLHGLRLEDRLAWNFSYHDGINPDGRLAPGNLGLLPERSGHYDAGVVDGKLPYTLGIFGPNVACPRTTLFFRNDAPDSDAIAFSLYRLHDWKTHVRYVWNANSAEENLAFYSGTDQYMSARLIGQERHWAMSILPRREVAVQSQDGSKTTYWYADNEMKGYDSKAYGGPRGGDPSARLFQRLGAYSLDWVKDLIFEWDEDLDAVYDDHREPLTYQEFDKMGKPGTRWDGMFWWGGADWAWRWIPIERYQDGMCYGAKAPGRTHWQLIAAYAASRKGWTAPQRLKVRSWIVHFVATYMLLDDNLPHQSMIGGHPNFLIESLYPGVFAAVFPNHPYNKAWKQIYQKLLEEYFRVYLRGDKPELGAQGGRHTESICCYSYASMAGVLHNAKGYRQFDGSDILAGTAFDAWVRWHMNALITAGPRELGSVESKTALTLTPPEGAHARHTGEVLNDVAEYFQQVQNPLGAQLKWCLTKGEQGTRPALRSALYYDYGPILRHDFGGPHEAYLHMQHLGSADKIPGYRTSSMNYRWRGDGDGVLYYAARGRNWSWNRREDCGDQFDIHGITAMEVPGGSLAMRKLDATARFLDLDPVQCFRSTEDPANPYVSREVLMVADRFLAVYDHLRDASVQGTFRWVNQGDDVQVESFDREDFTVPVKTFVDTGRFLISRQPSPSDESGQMAWRDCGVSHRDHFSVRFTTRLRIASDKMTFAQDLGAHDSGRLWLDGKRVLDGGDAQQAVVALKGGREVDFRYDFVHESGPIRCILKWGTEGERLTVVTGATSTTLRRDLPSIYPVREGPGDQLHIVEPSVRPTLAVEPKPYGAVVTEGSQRTYVLMAAAAGKYAEGDLIFHGRTAYAAPGAVFLCDGTRLSLGDLGVESSRAGLSISAVRTAAGRIEGRIAGRMADRAAILLPTGFDGQQATLRIDGRRIPVSYDSTMRALAFDVTLTLRDGAKAYTLTIDNR
jgi:hypothetical protein